MCAFGMVLNWSNYFFCYVLVYERQDGKLRCVSTAVDGEQLSRARETLVRLKAFPSSSFLIVWSNETHKWIIKIQSSMYLWSKARELHQKTQKKMYNFSFSPRKNIKYINLRLISASLTTNKINLFTVS